ncbi:MAG TPA: carboxypeptidase regulatory-like domain-containing protein [Dongiaceae bacterium]|nr:carboxypeptidase regulatory-like domain-containing protein [Dongiaceae bacterium]
MRLRVRLGLVIACTLAAEPAAAGIVTGTLWMTRESLEAHQKSGAEPTIRRQIGVTDAVIYVDALPEKVDEKLAATRRWFWQRRETPHLPRVVQNNRRFDPRVMSVPVGTRAEFQNLDHVYHNVFSVSPAKRFDLGKYPPGRIDTVAFERAGVINLHCDIHPDELAYIVVTPNHAVARPDSLGRFKLPKLPPGSYTLRVFHPRRGEFARPVAVPKKGDVSVDLAF